MPDRCFCVTKRLPNFLPKRLVEFEYLETKTDEDYQELARNYQKEIELAFFMVNFGLSKVEYESLRPIEKHFIYKAYENKLVSETTHIQRALQTAFYNVQRPKGSTPLVLWKRKTKGEATEHLKKAYEEMRQLEKQSHWVKYLYEQFERGG